MQSFVSTTFKVALKPTKGLDVLVESISKAGYLFRFVLLPAEILLRIFVYLIKAFLVVITFILSIASLVSGTLFKIYYTFGQKYFNFVGKAHNYPDYLEEKFINNNDFFSKKSYGYALKILLYIAKHFLQRFIELFFVLGRTIIPAIWFIVLITLFCVAIWPALFLESNLDGLIGASKIIINSFIDLYNFGASCYNFVVDIINSFRPVILLTVGYYVRLSFIWGNAMLETVGLASYKNRDLSQQEFFMDSTSQTMIDNHYFHSRALATNYFFAYDEQKKQYIRAGVEITGVTLIFKVISMAAFIILTIMYELSLVVWELIFAVIYPIFSGLFVFVSGPVQSGTCCLASPFCCFLETSAGVFSFLPGNGDALRCRESILSQSSCKCGRAYNVASNSGEGFYKFAPQCTDDTYNCLEDDEGLWGQYGETKFVEGQPVSGLIGLKSEDKSIACPRQEGALNQNSADFRSLIESHPIKPSSDCLNFCYSYKHKKNKGWLIQRCLGDEHISMLGLCRTDGVEVKTRRLDLNKDLSELKSHLKEFKRQYDPKKTMVSSEKHLSNRKKREEFMHQKYLNKKQEKD